MSVELTKAEAFAAPVVESLSVRLLVASFYDSFIDDASHPMVSIDHVRHIAGHERYLAASGGCPCIWSPPGPAVSPDICWISDIRRRC